MTSIAFMVIVTASTLFVMACENNGKPGEAPELLRFYVGSSDGSVDFSIFLCELDLNKNSFGVVDSFAGAKGPSYLAFSPKRKFLYTIDKTIADAKSGFMTVSSFNINKEDGSLDKLNSQSSQGNGPCHVFCSAKGTFLFTANYSSGNIASFPLGEDGAIAEAVSVVQSSGTGPVENRQKGPHTHYVSLDPDENFLLSPDLGSDKILLYTFDHETGILAPNPEQEFLKLDPGSGPRHLVFHPEGKFVYVANELNSTVTACRFEKKTGTLTILNTVSTVPETAEGSKFPAAIRIHPSGKFLYASTRGETSRISLFQVEDNGRIYRSQVLEDVPGWPRDFNIDPSGHFLLAAGERSDVIEYYKIDQQSGDLSKVGGKLSLPAPACILFTE